MISSMTGFGRGEFSDENRSCTVEIKSVNHRFIDMSLRMQRNISSMEREIKQKIKKSFKRGYIEVNISIEDNKNKGGLLVLDTELAKQYYECAEELQKTVGVKGFPDVNTFLNISGILKVDNNKISIDEYSRVIYPALDDALSSTRKMREDEGKALYMDMISRIDKISDCVNCIDSNILEVMEKSKTRFQERLKESIGDLKIDDSRIAQELAILSDKGDISEEIVRLKSHIKSFKKTINESNQSLGRKLEFILQEINREANTIASKSIDFSITDQVVNIKCELEKIREQVQNVE